MSFFFRIISWLNRFFRYILYRFNIKTLYVPAHVISIDDIVKLIPSVCQGVNISYPVLTEIQTHVNKVFKPIIARGNNPTKTLVRNQSWILRKFENGTEVLEVLSYKAQWHPHIPCLVETYIKNMIERLVDKAIDEKREVSVSDFENLNHNEPM